MKNRGFIILETLIYMVILVVVIFMIFKSVTSMIVIHRKVILSEALESSSSLSMERILREIRNASSVDIVGSSFGVSPGVLKLSGIDPDGAAYTITFDMVGGVMRIAKNAGTPSALTSGAITVNSLIFRHLSNSNSEAVRVEVSFVGNTGSDTKTLDLSGFAVLRGSY